MYSYHLGYSGRFPLSGHCIHFHNNRNCHCCNHTHSGLNYYLFYCGLYQKPDSQYYYPLPEIPENMVHLPYYCPHNRNSGYSRGIFLIFRYRHYHPDVSDNIAVPVWYSRRFRQCFPDSFPLFQQYLSCCFRCRLSSENLFSAIFLDHHCHSENISPYIYCRKEDSFLQNL